MRYHLMCQDEYDITSLVACYVSTDDAYIKQTELEALNPRIIYWIDIIFLGTCNHKPR